MPRASSARLQQIAGGRIELALHQRRHEMQTVTSMPCALRPAAASSPSRPPPMTTALPRDFGGEQHRVDVVEIAIGQHAGEIVRRAPE